MYWKRRRLFYFSFFPYKGLAVEHEKNWWFGCSKAWVLQTLWYCANWKILVQAEHGKQSEAGARTALCF